MAVNKVFYKKKPIEKFFFDKNMKVRSLAFGQAVQEEFIAWQRFINQKKNVFGEGFSLFEQTDVGGDIKSDFLQSKNSNPIEKLSFDGVVYQIKKDGFVWVNDKRSGLCVGTEIKAFSLFYFTDNDVTYKGIAVISKPIGAKETRLCLYRVLKTEPETSPFMVKTLSPTLDNKSWIFCLGKHLLIVHNSTLDYLFINVKDDCLDCVSIGGDDNNDNFEWCQLIYPHLAVTEDGGVFWLSDTTVYGFKVGYPKRLIKIDNAQTEKAIFVRGGKTAVSVYKKDKNSGKITCFTYNQL